MEFFWVITNDLCHFVPNPDHKFHPHISTLLLSERFSFESSEDEKKSLGHEFDDIYALKNVIYQKGMQVLL